MKTEVDTKTCTWLFTAALFITAKKQKQPNAHQAQSTIGYNHTTEYYLVIKKLSIHATTWMKLENRTLNESIQTKRLCMVQFH
jgi:hypothetical protein